MTAIFSVICGKYDESQDLENDFKDKHRPLNKHVFFSENISYKHQLVSLTNPAWFDVCFIHRSLFVLQKRAKISNLAQI